MWADPRWTRHVLWPLLVAAFKGGLLVNQRTRFVIEALAQVIAWAQGTEHYQQLLDVVEEFIEQAIPEHAIEPRIGQFLVDLGQRLQQPGPARG